MPNYDVEKIVVPDSGSSNDFLAGLLASACQQKNLDLSSVMALCNGNRGGLGGFGLDGIIALIVVAAIFGNGNGGGLFGGGNNRGGDTERQMIMDAIQRNGVDLSQLASTLNCTSGQIQAAINQVASKVCDMSGQLGTTGASIINSIQQGNMQLTQQICNCCCDLKSVINQQTNALQQDLNFINRSVERGFADLGYATRDQTCSIEKSIAASTESILAGQRAAEMREMQRELAERDRKISEQAIVINNGQQSGVFAQMLNQAVAPINTAVAALAKELGDIQCKLPETKVISCPDNYVKVNTGFNIPLAVAPAAYGACGIGAYSQYGPYGNNGGWG